MLEKFFKYVEIRTKITSLFAFLMSVAFLFHSRQPINAKLTVIFFASMFIFDLTTTAINNYIDSRDYPEMLPLPRRASLIIIWVMFLISAALGLYLAYCTDIVVLLVGVLCFLCGVFYTYGPIPISRLPLGEVCGTLVPFLILYINMPKGTYLSLTLNFQEINLTLQVLPLLTLLLLCVIPTCLTAGIMLANNTCDVEKDVESGRRTLSVLLGRERARKLYHGVVYAWVAAIVVLVAAFFTNGLLVMPFMLLASYPLLKALLGNPLAPQARIGAMAQVCSANIALGAFYAAAILASGIAVAL